MEGVIAQGPTVEVGRGSETMLGHRQEVQKMLVLSPSPG